MKKGHLSTYRHNSMRNTNTKYDAEQRSVHFHAVANSIISNSFSTLTFAPIWLPHWPAWMWTISLMLLGSFLDFFKVYCDYRTNDEIHANSSREPRNEYALEAASVTDFQASARPRGATWGDANTACDWSASKPRHLFTSQRQQRCQLLYDSALQLLRMWHRWQNFDSPKLQANAVDPRIQLFFSIFLKFIFLQ